MSLLIIFLVAIPTVKLEFEVNEQNKNYSYPSVVSVAEVHYASEIPEPKCTGIMVSEKQVVTACSCVGDFINERFELYDSKKMSNLRVLVGKTNTDIEPKAEFYVQRLVPYDKCKYVAQNVKLYDMAVIEVVGRFPSFHGNTTLPIPLGQDDFLKFLLGGNPVECVGIGWGIESDSFDGKLRQINVALLSIEDCGISICEKGLPKCLLENEMLEAGMLCGESNLSCVLDRGSPVYCNRKLYAIISSGQCDRGRPSSPFVITRLDKLQSFIVKSDAESSHLIANFNFLFLFTAITIYMENAI